MYTAGAIFASASSIKDYSGNRYPDNAGKSWLPQEDELIRYYDRGMTWQNMCLHLGRTPNSVFSKLTSLGFITYEVDGNYYCIHASDNKEIQMNDNHLTTIAPVEKPLIEIRTFVLGRDARELTDDQLFDVIAQQEARVEQLCKVKNKPQKLKDKIGAIKADIDALVKFIDAR